MPDLSVKLGPLTLKNPLMTASGTFGYGMEYAGFFPPEDLGAVVVKGVTTRQVHGNPTPRVAEVVSGMLNAIGLQGPGVDLFLHDDHYQSTNSCNWHKPSMFFPRNADLQLGYPLRTALFCRCLADRLQWRQQPMRVS